uniref:Leukosialin n=1 Tax=Salvator merianae TaxID=96440 RepID=A0A8D0B5S2_SALMN
MEKSRSLLQKLPVYSVSIGFLILLTMDSFIDAQNSTSATKTTYPAADEASSKADAEVLNSSTLHLVTGSSIAAELDPTTPVTPDKKGLKHKPTPGQPSSPIKHNKIMETFETSPSRATLMGQESTSTIAPEQPVHISGKVLEDDGTTVEPSSEATTAAKSTSAPGKTTTMDKSTSAPRKTMVKSTLASDDITVIVTSTLGSSPELHPRGKPGSSTKGKDRITTPEQQMPDDTKTDASSAVPGSWSTTALAPRRTGETTPGTIARPSSADKVKIIVAIVIAVLLLLLILCVFVYCRRRHRSGSTSFTASEWAGQATVPDDSGLERDAERGTVIVGGGEGESRRSTLVTFFGKRQSRTASVAMEEIDRKGDGNESQKLKALILDTRGTHALPVS